MDYYTNVGAAAIVMVGLTIGLVMYYRPESLLSSSFVGVFTAIIVGVAVLALMYYKSRSIVPAATGMDSSTVWLVRYASLVGVACLLLVVYTGLKTSGILASIARNTSPTITGYILNLILAGIVLYGLATYQVIFADYLQRLEGWPGFIVNVLFAVPCYLSGMVRYLLQEYATTPRVVAALLAIEVLLILAYLYVPPFIQKIQSKTVPGIPIQKDVLYLNRKTTLSNEVHKSTRQKKSEQWTARLADMGTNQLYAFAMWVYILPVDVGDSDLSDSDKYTIFRFGDLANPKHGAPCIRYAGGNNAPYDTALQRGDHWRFHLTSAETDSGTLLSVPSQKWNYVVVNYSNNGADVFINGELRHHQTFTPAQLPVYLDTDVFILGGDNDHGLGAIREVTYYDRPVSQPFMRQQIAAQNWASLPWAFGLK